VEIRERLNLDTLSSINDIVVKHSFEKLGMNDAPNPSLPSFSEHPSEGNDEGDPNNPLSKASSDPSCLAKDDGTSEIKREGKLLMDATVAPQNITYPTDLKLLNAARIKSEQLIDKLYNSSIHKT